MSDQKTCDWCHLENQPSHGRFRNGQWVCYTCFPENTGFVFCTRKCDLCQNKASQGTVVGRSFFCVSCSGSPQFQQKSGKKKKKQWVEEIRSRTKEPRPSKKQKKQKYQHEPQKVKIERWKVLIEDISTGDL